MILPSLVAALLAFIAPLAGQDAWRWPVDPPRRVLKAFVGPPEPWLPGHRGIDIAARAEVLLAPAAGIVRFAGRVVDRGVLSIDHGDGIVSSYEPVEAVVAEGEAVARGQVIASIDLGHCAVPCVHVGVRIDGEYRNPLRWLGGAEWPVLLPTRR
ncbi:MAG TPA: M23 family metallopeptidase [Microbacteriaceae bacterium]|nr:M23 family metallopeptidase [Microbacteriaceae bacterium]